MTNINNAVVSEVASSSGSDFSEIDENNQSVSGKSLVPIDQSVKPHLHLVNTLQEKFRSLPVIYDSDHAVSASALLSQRFVVPYSEDNYQKSRRELSAIMLGAVLFIFVSIISWGLSTEINFLNGGEFVYNTGLIGGVLMLLTLIHSIIKRITFISRFFSTARSYYFHVICGSLGALFIVIHSSFDFRSINSSVAIVCMMLILLAGAFGRYMYTQFTLSLHRLYLQVKEIESDLFKSILTYRCNTAKGVREQLSALVTRNLIMPKSFFSGLWKGISSPIFSLYVYITSLRDLYKIINSATTLGDFESDEIRKVKQTHRRELGIYIFKVTQMGMLNMLEQVFRYWRILHVPFLYILVLTSVVHVIVVHMY